MLGSEPESAATVATPVANCSSTGFSAPGIADESAVAGPDGTAVSADAVAVGLVAGTEGCTDGSAGRTG